MKSTNDETINLGTESIDPEEVKQELLRKVPTKVARKRAKQIIINQEAAESQGCAGNHRQHSHHTRHHNSARLHLRRLQGRHPWAYS